MKRNSARLLHGSVNGIARDNVVPLFVSQNNKASSKVARDTTTVLSGTTSENIKRSLDHNSLDGPTSCFPYTDKDIVSGSVGPLHNDQSSADFRREVSSKMRAQLIAAYPREYSRHCAMLGREREGKNTVDDALRGFKDFLMYMGQPLPNRKWSIDRIDNADDYRPGNVRWADKRQQAGNRSNTIHLTGPDGHIRTLTDWARHTSQSADTMRKRLARGWTHVEVIKGFRTRANDSSPAKVCTTIDVKERGEWPEGIDPTDWEIPYQQWLRLRYGGRPNADVRYVFVAWITGNIRKQVWRKLAERYPIFNEDYLDDDDDGSVPEHIVRDKLYQKFFQQQQVFASALGIVLSNAKHVSALRSLRASRGPAFSPREAVKLEAQECRQRRLRS